VLVARKNLLDSGNKSNKTTQLCDFKRVQIISIRKGLKKNYTNKTDKDGFRYKL
jgi:hypothetical protein